MIALQLIQLAHLRHFSSSCLAQQKVFCENLSFPFIFNLNHIFVSIIHIWCALDKTIIYFFFYILCKKTTHKMIGVFKCKVLMCSFKNLLKFESDWTIFMKVKAQQNKKTPNKQAGNKHAIFGSWRNLYKITIKNEP